MIVHTTYNLKSFYYIFLQLTNISTKLRKQDDIKDWISNEISKIGLKNIITY